MRPPDIDRKLDYFARWGGPGRCRLRAWHDEALVVVSDLGDENPGPSVTNAIEAIASVVELVLVIPVERLRLVEHYPATAARPSTWDLVTFQGRREGVVVGPVWVPAPEDLRRQIREAIEGVDA